MKTTTMKKRINLITLTAIGGVLLTSCMAVRTPVGKFRESSGSEYTYSKGKQIWLFWGLFPIGRVSVATPSDGNCEVIVKFNFGDFLISGITGGIVTTETVKVKAKK